MMLLTSFLLICYAPGPSSEKKCFDFSNSSRGKKCFDFSNSSRGKKCFDFSNPSRGGGYIKGQYLLAWCSMLHSC